MNLPESSATHLQLRTLAAYNALENRAYTADEAVRLIGSNKESIGEPDWERIEASAAVLESAYKKSLRKSIASLKRRLEVEDREDEREIMEDEKVGAECSLEEFLEEIQDAKEEAKERIVFLQDEIADSGWHWSESIRRPTQKQIKECVLELDQTQPNWDDSCSVLVDALKGKFPELDRDIPRLRLPPARSGARHTQKAGVEQTSTSIKFGFKLLAFFAWIIFVPSAIFGLVLGGVGISKNLLLPRFPAFGEPFAYVENNADLGIVLFVASATTLIFCRVANWFCK